MKADAQQIHQLLTEIQASEVSDTNTLLSLKQQSETLQQDIQKLEKQLLDVGLHKLKDAKRQAAHQKVKTYETLHKAVGVWEDEVLPLLMKKEKYIDDLILMIAPKLKNPENSLSSVNVHNKHKNNTGDLHDGINGVRGVDQQNRNTDPNMNFTEGISDATASSSHDTSFPSITEIVMKHLKTGQDDNFNKTSIRSLLNHFSVSSYAMDKQALAILFSPHTSALALSQRTLHGITERSEGTLVPNRAKEMSNYGDDRRSMSSTSLSVDDGALPKEDGNKRREERVRDLLQQSNVSFFSYSSPGITSANLKPDPKSDMINFLVVLEALKVAAKQAPSRLLFLQRQSLNPTLQTKEMLYSNSGNRRLCITNTTTTNTTSPLHIHGDLKPQLACDKENKSEAKRSGNKRTISFLDDDGDANDNTHTDDVVHDTCTTNTVSTVLGRILNNNNNKYSGNITAINNNINRSASSSILPISGSSNVNNVTSGGFTSASDVIMMSSKDITNISTQRQISENIQKDDDENNTTDTSVVDHHHREKAKKVKKSKKEKKSKKARHIVENAVMTTTNVPLSNPYYQPQPKRTILSLSKNDYNNDNIVYNNTGNDNIGDSGSTGAHMHSSFYSSSLCNSSNFTPQQLFEQQRKQSNITEYY